MTLETSIALAVGFFLLMAAPGPGTMAVLARGLSGGFRSTIPFMLGMLLGDLVYLLAAIVGLAALAAEFGGLLTLVRWAGAAYLVYLGIQLWRQPAALPDAAPPANRRDFVAGFGLTLGNPKVILCYTAFLPGFVDLTSLSAVDAFSIAGIVTFVLLAVLAGYAFMAGRLNSVVSRAEGRRRLDRASGSAMIAAGGIIVARQ